MLVLYIRLPINFFGTRISLTVLFRILNSFNSIIEMILFPSLLSMSDAFTENIIKNSSFNFCWYLCAMPIKSIWTAYVSKNFMSWFVSDLQKTVSMFHHLCNLIKISVCWREKADYKRFLCQAGKSLVQVYGFRLKKHTGTCAMLQFIWHVQGTIITNTGMSDMYLPTSTVVSLPEQAVNISLESYSRDNMKTIIMGDFGRFFRVVMVAGP